MKNILFLAANPKGTSPLKLDQEAREIGEELRRSHQDDQFSLEQRWAVRPRDIQQAMLDVGPHIVHFSGHGQGTKLVFPAQESLCRSTATLERKMTPPPERSEPIYEAGLVFEDEQGQAKLVSGEALAGLFELFTGEVECVLLNGCYSATQAMVIAQHVPYVIGMSDAISDKAAIEFAVGFYKALGAGRPIEFAYKLGCNAIQMEGIAEHLTPVLLKQTTPNVQAKPDVMPPLIPPAPLAPPVNEPIEVFISYSHKDESLKDELYVHLANLTRQGKIRPWQDRAIEAGTEWDAEIKAHLESAGVILLLITPRFIASEYCFDKEMQRAMERHAVGTARVVPIIMKPCDWQDTPFSKLQVLPKDAKPVTSWSDQDEALLDVVKGIRRAVDSIPAHLTPVLVSTSNRTSSIQTKPSAPPEFPSGPVGLESQFYIERFPNESRHYQSIQNPGCLLRIMAPDLMGKTSLMARILDHATQQNYQKACLNLRDAEQKVLTDLNSFLYWFSDRISSELGLEHQIIDHWDDQTLGCISNCTNYFEKHILSRLDQPIALGVDEVDRIFPYPDIATDFFGMLRNWFEKGRNHPTWKKLRLVLAYSTEDYSQFRINQSPFNVGEPLKLRELTQLQVQALSNHYGLHQWTEQQIKSLMAMVGGHPYLLRLAMYYVSTQEMDLEQLLQEAPTEDGIYSDHLHRYWKTLSGNPQLAATLQTVMTANAPVSIERSLSYQLRSMGLVQYEGNSVRPSCNLYRLYFSK